MLDEQLIEKEEEILLNSTKVKRIIKESCDSPNMRLSGSGLQYMSEIATEFIDFISLAALDRSERPKQYVDSVGIMKALKDLGFKDIAAEIPDLDGYTEDMNPE